MNFAAIAPIARLRDIEENAVHMALAHLCDNEKYVNFYKGQSDQGKFIILDNSVIELGKAVTPEFLLEAAGKIGAHEIVVPDVYNNASETVKLARQFIPKIKNHGYRLMGVAHGKNISEWLWCVRNLIECGVDTIGVPKVIVQNMGSTGRVNCLRNLARKFAPYEIPTIHLLGVWDDPLEMIRIYLEEAKGTINRIRSVDSAIAYVYASYGYHFGEGARPKGKVNFFTGDCNGYIHLKNIMEMRQMCGDPMRLCGLEDEYAYTGTEKIVHLDDGVIKVDFQRG